MFDKLRWLCCLNELVSDFVTVPHVLVHHFFHPQ
jgi:hypothetical protein